MSAPTGPLGPRPQHEAQPPFHSGFVALLGRPNVGKSTLVNRLVGSKVSIVSDHPQTTRRRISGVVTGPDFQAVLLDLPGFQKPFDSLTTRMQAIVDAALTEVDAALLLLSATETLGGGDRFIAEAVQRSNVPFVCLLNKCDAVPPRVLEQRLAAAVSMLGAGRVRPVSAKRGDGVGEMMLELIAALPEGPKYFPEGTASDQPVVLLVGELIREQALRVARDELPHAIAVSVEELRERPDAGLIEIEADLLVEHESQKPILIGRGGQTIKRIGSQARQQIESVLGTKVYLSLRVKVRRRWRRDDAAVDRFL